MTFWGKQILKFMVRIVAVCVFMLWASSNLDTPAPAVRPDAVGSPQELASRMDCWTTGNHGIPTNVVYRMDGDWKIGGIPAVDRAFSQIFDGIDAGMTIYAFCKG